MSFATKLSIALKSIVEVKNWPTFWADGFKLIKNKDVLYMLKDGAKFILRGGTADKLVLSEVFFDKCYCPAGFEISEKDTVVDIGAHVGIFSVFAALTAKSGIVYSFEPTGENFRMLKANVELNNLQNVQPVQMAVAGKSGQLELFFNDQNTGGHSISSEFKRGAPVPSLKVQAISMADVFETFKLSKIDFLKMDCEGAEYEIFTNCPDELLGKIGKISMEYHYMDEGKNLEFLKGFLAKKGFAVQVKPPAGKMLGMLYAKR